MPSPGKRDFDEFHRDFTTTFPPSPLSYDNGFHAVKVRQEKYQARIKRAYDVAIQHPAVDPSRYMPGAYPDDIVLPEMMVSPHFIIRGAVTIYQGVEMAQNTFTSARRVYHKTRKAISNTQKVVIAAVGLIGCAKRRAIQVFTRRSNQDIVRDASRVPASRSSPQKRRQSPPRPSTSSSSISISVPPTVHQEPTTPEVRPGAYPHFEAISSSVAGPSITNSKPIALLQALLKNKDQKKGEKTPRFTKKGEKTPRSDKKKESALHGVKSTDSKVTKCAYDLAGNPFPMGVKGQCRLVAVPGPDKKHPPMTFRRAPQTTALASLPTSTNTSVVPSPLLFPAPVAPSSSVADATNAAPVDKQEPISTPQAAGHHAAPIDALEDTSAPQPAEQPSPPIIAQATSVEPVDESQVLPVDKAASIKTVGQWELPLVEQQSPLSPAGTYNEYADISMADASLLDEAVAPPTRRIHWYASPRTGGPVSDTRIITPRQDHRPFSLIFDSSALASCTDEAKLGGIGPTNAENASVNGPDSVPPILGAQTTTSNASPLVAVENTPTIEPEQVANAPPPEPASVESVQDEMGILSVSQATANDRRAKLAATKVAKAAEKKRREEEAVRVRKEAEEAERRKRVRRTPVQPVITPLSAEWDGKVTAALSERNDHVCATTPRESVELTRRDFATALPQSTADGIGYLNDEIINGYLEAVTDYGNGTAGGKALARSATPKVFAWTSHFYSTLRDKGYKAVSRWSKKRNIDGRKLLDVEQVLVPINESYHWMLLVISPKSRTIEFFDSLLGSGANHIKNIKIFLAAELGDLYVESEWNILPSKSSRQLNGIDCGVFSVTTAKMVVLGVEPRFFTHRDTQLQRRRIVAELMNGGFVGEFEPNVVF